MRVIIILLAIIFNAYGPVMAQEVLFAGDVTLTKNITPAQKEFFTQRAKDFINNADLFIWNLEFSGMSNNKKSKPFVFSCDSDIVSAMKFDNGVATVANNHSFDGNVEGFKNLIQSLDKHDMKYSGLKNQDSQKNYIEISKGDNKFFVLNYSPMSHSNDPVYNTSTWDNVLDSVKYINSIKTPQDFIIVNIHDGIEKTTKTSPGQQANANILADLGVDVINFTHSHTYIEPTKIKDSVVLWGMGNFIFGGNNNWRNNKDVRMMAVNLKDKTWNWVKGHTGNYVFDIDAQQ